MISDERINALWLAAIEDISQPTVENFARAVAQEARREALEEAADIAQVCGLAGTSIAMSIRALIEDNEGVQPEDCTCVGFHTNCSKENQNA